MVSRRQFIATLAAVTTVGFAKAVPERGACGVCHRLLTDPNDLQVLTKYARCRLHGGDGSLFNPRHAMAEAYHDGDIGMSVRFIKHYDMVKDANPTQFDCIVLPDGTWLNLLNGSPL